MSTEITNNNKTPTTEQIKQQLELILDYPRFAEAPRLSEFLRYVVNETLEGRAGHIKGFTIASEVFDRADPEDAQTSTVVRVEAGRLRRRLFDYYSTQGANDPVRIDIPKGAYVPTFELCGAPATTAEVEQSPSYRPRRDKLKPQVITTGAALLVVALLLGWWYFSQGSDQRELTVELASSRPSIAVLPFENALQDQNNFALGNGITEDIITDLSSLVGIDVIAYSSISLFRNTTIDLDIIAKKLNVSHILRGSIRSSGDKIRVTAQLYESGTGNQIWAERFDRELGDLLTLQDELATRIVEGMAVGLQGENWKPQEHSKASNREARILFKQAMDIANPPSDPRRLQIALRAFEALIEEQPEFAGGYAGAAYIHSFFAFWGHHNSPDEDIRKTFEHAKHAISLKPSSGMAFSAMAFAHLSQRDFDQAITWSESAVRAQPGDPYVMIYHGVILLFNGQAEDGIKFAERALRLDPLYPRTPYLNILGMCQFHAGNLQSAFDYFQRSLDRGGPQSSGMNSYRIAALALLGRTSEAKSILRLTGMYGDEGRFETWLRRVFRHAGDADKVINALNSISN